MLIAFWIDYCITIVFWTYHYTTIIFCIDFYIEIVFWTYFIPFPCLSFRSCFHNITYIHIFLGLMISFVSSNYFSLLSVWNIFIIFHYDVMYLSTCLLSNYQHVSFISTYHHCILYQHTIFIYQRTIIVLTYIPSLYSISIYHISISTYHYCIDIPINLMILINTSSYFILTYHFCISIPCIYQHSYYQIFNI